ncbi:MAG TPA: hypothetical protein DCL15_11135 [Chloroflexi bacterium]|nr:hypothetical protein [Chloroflexota bacterium]HHW87975.1 hypothetical protein [Chloroflexota bacterium]
MSQSQPHSMSAHNNWFHTRCYWRLLEIILWSTIGWFYWMALMVLIVWAVAQVQVETTLRQKPELTYRLHEYAHIGRDWQLLSATADVARPVLGLLQNQEFMAGLVFIRLTPKSSIALATLKTSLETAIHVGDEMRDLSELQQTAEDIERYLAEPSAESLRASMQSYADGAKAVQRAQQDFEKVVSTAEPLVQTSSSVAGAIADALRTLDPLASTMGLGQPMTQFADYLEQLPRPVETLVYQARKYSDQAAADAVLLQSIHTTIATADMRETVCTYIIFRSFIHWFLKYVWWIDAVVVAAIIVRLLLAYLKLFSPTAARQQTRPGFATSATI